MSSDTLARRPFSAGETDSAAIPFRRGVVATTLPRINVIGNAAVGKSTLALRLGRMLGLPVFDLDTIAWRPRWRRPPAEEREASERALAAEPSWVIDGHSRFIRERATVIIFLDYPRCVSFWRCAKRTWPYLFRSRPGFPPACPQIRILPSLVRYIWTFPTEVRPTLLAEFQGWLGRKTLVHIRSQQELNEFLDQLDQNGLNALDGALSPELGVRSMDL